MKALTMICSGVSTAMGVVAMMLGYLEWAQIMILFAILNALHYYHLPRPQ